MNWSGPSGNSSTAIHLHPTQTRREIIIYNIINWIPPCFNEFKWESRHLSHVERSRLWCLSDLQLQLGSHAKAHLRAGNMAIALIFADWKGMSHENPDLMVLQHEKPLQPQRVPWWSYTKIRTGNGTAHPVRDVPHNNNKKTETRCNGGLLCQFRLDPFRRPIPGN